MEKRALELVFHGEVRQLFDHFCSLLSIRIALFDADGKEVVAGLDKPSCRYCRLLRGRLSLEDRCKEQDKTKLEEARTEDAMVSYRCHAGLNEAIQPVSIGGRHLGFIMIGQFRSRYAMPKGLDERWRRERGGPDLRDAFEAVPYYSPSRLRDILAIFRLLVNSVASRGLVSTKRADVLERLLAVMRERPAEPMSLDDAARLAGRSPSTVSHLFTRQLGRSFKSSQIAARLERAEVMLTSRPGVTVKEVAYALGYDDPLYFSRVFKKYRGVPPSALLRR